MLLCCLSDFVLKLFWLEFIFTLKQPGSFILAFCLLLKSVNFQLSWGYVSLLFSVSGLEKTSPWWLQAHISLDFLHNIKQFAIYRKAWKLFDIAGSYLWSNQGLIYQWSCSTDHILFFSSKHCCQLPTQLCIWFMFPGFCVVVLGAANETVAISVLLVLRFSFLTKQPDNHHFSFLVFL